MSKTSIPEMFRRYLALDETPELTTEHRLDLAEISVKYEDPTTMLNEWELRYMVQLEQRLTEEQSVPPSAPHAQLTLSFTRAQWHVIDRALTHYCQSRSGSRDLPAANQLLWDIRDSLSEQEKERHS